MTGELSSLAIDGFNTILKKLNAKGLNNKKKIINILDQNISISHNKSQEEF